MVAPQPALPPTSGANFASSVRAMLFMAAAVIAGDGANYLVAHGYITSDMAAQAVAVGSGVIISTATLAWSFLQNHFQVKMHVAAAATGNPQADPNAPSTQDAIARAIASPLSPITAKP